MSKLASLENIVMEFGAIRALDLNPVMVSAGGAVVVDALMEVAG